MLDASEQARRDAAVCSDEWLVCGWCDEVEEGKVLGLVMCSRCMTEEGLEDAAGSLAGQGRAASGMQVTSTLVRRETSV